MSTLPEIGSERSALARERARWVVRIHDRLTQSVTSALLEVQTLRRRIEADPQEAIASLEDVEVAIREDLHDIRELLFELQEGDDPSPGTLEDAVHRLADRWKLTAEIVVEGDPGTIEEPVRTAAEAIAGEALANAAKHSGASEVVVLIREDAGGVRLEVEDRGHEGLTGAGDPDLHLGLQLMRERAEGLGGSVWVEPTPDRGVRVTSVLPAGETAGPAEQAITAEREQGRGAKR